MKEKNRKSLSESKPVNKQTGKNERREEKRTRESESRVVSHSGLYICQSSINFPTAVINTLYVSLPIIEYLSSIYLSSL